MDRLVSLNAALTTIPISQGDMFFNLLNANKKRLPIPTCEAYVARIAAPACSLLWKSYLRARPLEALSKILETFVYCLEYDSCEGYYQCQYCTYGEDLQIRPVSVIGTTKVLKVHVLSILGTLHSASSRGNHGCAVFMLNDQISDSGMTRTASIYHPPNPGLWHINSTIMHFVHVLTCVNKRYCSVQVLSHLDCATNLSMMDLVPIFFYLHLKRVKRVNVS